MQRWMYYIIVGMAILILGGLVIYGVISHKEPGLLSACFQNNLVIAYHDPIKSPHLECTTEVKWKREQLPLTYFISFGEDHKEYISSITTAADLWNREIGNTVFKQVDNVDDSLIEVSWGSVSKEDHVGGYTVHTGDDKGLTGAKVILSNPSDLHAVHRYVVHEFGHVLGLAHDDFAKSIMFPSAPDTTGGMGYTLPSDSDKKLLRNLYK